MHQGITLMEEELGRLSALQCQRLKPLAHRIQYLVPAMIVENFMAPFGPEVGGQWLLHGMQHLLQSHHALAHVAHGILLATKQQDRKLVGQLGELDDAVDLA